MKIRVRKCMYLAVAMLLFVAAGAFAQCTTTATTSCVTYTGANGYALNGTAIGPQTAVIDGTSMTVISTDYADAAMQNSSPYQAFNQTLGSLDTPHSTGPVPYSWGNTMWGAAINANALTSPEAMAGGATGNYTWYDGSSDPQQVYELAAYMASTMIGCATTTCTYSQADYQNAIWFVMDPTDLTNLYESGTTTASCQNNDVCHIVDDAFNAVYNTNTVSLDSYSSVQLISEGYGTLEDPVCPSLAATTSSNPLPGGCGQPEFLAFATPAVAAPETSESLILATNLIGLAALAFVFRRRLICVKQ